MKKRLRTIGNKKKTKKILTIYFFLVIVVFLFFHLIYYTYNKSLIKDNALIVDLIFEDPLGGINVANLENLKNPSFLFKYMLNQNLELIKNKIDVDSEPVIKNKDYQIYIYNSHPSEAYDSSSLEPFSITPTVVTADYILKEYLSEYSIISLVEEKSVIDILRQNGWKYGYSYKASRILLEEAYNNNPSLELFLDIHRDSALKNVTTVNIDGVSYAKVMFVIGLEHENYQENLTLAKKINDIIIGKYPSLSRGIIEKKGLGVNGIYNQDFNPKCLLIEIGGPENSLEEINNTIKVLAVSLANYMEELNGI